MKKLVLLVLPLLSVLIAIPVSASSAPVPPVTTNAAESYALAQQILLPAADGNFHGEATVTRLEFTIAVLDDLYPNENVDSCYGSIAPSPQSPFSLLFTDVQSQTWYGKRLCTAMRAGLVRGNPDGSFRPFAGITIGEAAKILASADGLASGDENGSRWYANAMNALSMHGAIAESIAPQTPLSREAMANMFYALRDSEPVVVAPTPAQHAQGQASSLSSVSSAAATTTSAPENSSVAAVTSGCTSFVAPRSPGAALYAEGRSIIRVSDVHLSHRLLVEEVDASGPGTGSMTRSAPDGVPTCWSSPPRSPGIALLMQGGVSAHPDYAQRVSERTLRDEEDALALAREQAVNPVALP